MIEAWQEILMYTVKNRKGKFAFYPFGDNALLIKRFLNDVLGVSEDLRIDNQYSQFTDYVIPIDSINEIGDFQEHIYIISSIIHCFAQELLLRGVPEENIILCYPEYTTCIKRFVAYNDAIMFILKRLHPRSIYDAQLYFENELGKSLYSGINYRTEFLTEIELYSDKDKITQLFPAQKKIYSEIQCDSVDMVLCVNDFNVPSNLKCQTTVVISQNIIMELERLEICKFMYSYLYVYILKGDSYER